MRENVVCGSCRAALEVEIVLEPAEAVEAGADPVREGSAEELSLRCPRCGSRIALVVPPGAEQAEVRLKE
jgi:DNA-directed RNA polymerase subunit RPC12/RpoP